MTSKGSDSGSEHGDIEMRDADGHAVATLTVLKSQTEKLVRACERLSGSVCLPV